MSKGILLFGNHPPPFGGVPTHIQYLAPFLAARGWDVHVLSMEANHTWGFNCIEKCDGYTVYRPSIISRFLHLFSLSSFPRGIKVLLSLPLPKSFLGALSWASYVKKIVRKNNIQIISAYHIFHPALASAMVCQEMSIPLITTVFGEIYSLPDFHKSHLDAVKYVVNASHKILSCSKHCAESFNILGLSPQVEAVYYGIDISRFSPKNDGSGVSARLGIGTSDKVVIFVGRMVEEMGLHVLLDAIPQILNEKNDVKFLIVGKSGELLPMARKIALRYPKNIYIVPDAPFEELPLYYAAATIAIIPSINDRACLGLAIVEAMASGKPVIVSNIGGGPEVVSAGESGYLVPANDSNALAEEILEVLNLEKKRLHDMGRLGRERAVAVFDKDSTNIRMEQVFLEALS